jgi:hypothetical protein
MDGTSKIWRRARASFGVIAVEVVVVVVVLVFVVVVLMVAGEGACFDLSRRAAVDQRIKQADACLSEAALT